MKTYIYNKVKTAAKRASLLLLTPLILATFTSCLDTIILPDDKTVDEDFWQTKEDVASMVNAAYAAMASDEVITRLIVWGDYRSDEMVRNSSITDTESKVKSITEALDEIAAVNMQTTNTYAAWSSLYTVINRCNIVLERAEEVINVDPNYTRPNYESDRCQMLALRSLCYFYLVRNFRDVPYVTEAYMNSSKNTVYEQSAPLYVIDRLIETLEEVAANGNCLRSNSYTVNEWRRVGWLTLDGVRSLLADIYLWRASVMHSAADYQKCSEYCDLVIESKKNQHVRKYNEVTAKEYPLADGRDMYEDLFNTQNAEESIFELQSRNNTAVLNFFHKYKNENSTEGYMKASSVFGSQATAVDKVGASNVFTLPDLRYYATTYFNTSSDGESYHIRKMIAQSSVTSLTTQSRTERAYSNFLQNYIIYRLTDVMLMKAEAQVQLMKDLSDTATEEEKAENRTNLYEAFKLVQAVNTRALYVDNQKDSIQWKNYSNYSKGQMELLVMQERLRELCFEGKRWYDLLRYNYRHIDDAQYDKTYNTIMGGNTGNRDALPMIYNEMLKLMTRSRNADAFAIQAKMRNDAYLYMPIPESDLNVSPLLNQNPAYKSTNAYEKSY